MIHMVQWWCSYWDQCSHKLIFFLYAVHIYFVYNYKYIPSKYSILFTALTTYLDCKQILWVYRNLLHYCRKRLPFIGYSTCKEKENPRLAFNPGTSIPTKDQNPVGFFQNRFLLSSNIIIQNPRRWSQNIHECSIFFMNSKRASLNSMLCNRMGLQVSNPNAAQWLTS